jgi:hypothetical protein
MRSFGVRLGFGLALSITVVLLVAVVVSVVVIQNGVVTRLTLGFLVLAVLDLGLFANMLRRLPRREEEVDEAGP